MKLVVNYLREVQELFEEGKIDFVDYFKLYSINGDLSPIDWCIKNKPLMFHGFVGKGSQFGDSNMIENIDIEKSREIIEISKTPYVSGHIMTNAKDQTKEETIKAISNNIKKVKEIFGKDVLIENTPFREQRRYCLYLYEPDVIAKLVRENDCGFLFDISHARRSADGLNMSFDEYISKLPMEKVVEFHLAGMTKMPDGTESDSHGKMREEDYKFLEEALKKYKSLEYITLEYGSWLPKDDIKNRELAKKVNLPLADYDEINPIVKDEVYEQLIRIKEIMKK